MSPSLSIVRRVSQGHPIAGAHLALALLTAFCPLIASCAGVAEGVTRALIESDDEPDHLQCEITGPSFQGIEGIMLDQSAQPQRNPGAPSESVKVMAVHGMGSPKPGYSARLQENLTRELGLTVRSLHPKEIGLRSTEFSEIPLGTLTVWHYTNEMGTREMTFFELTWSEIVEIEKEALAYDTSGEFSHKRAALNHMVKEFLNTRMSDPVIYASKVKEKILESVVQAHCWMYYLNWSELPTGVARACDWLAYGSAEDLAHHRIVFITHSMGSRVMIDSLGRDVQFVEEFMKSTPTTVDDVKGRELIREFQRKEFHVYMMANQLPLMQLGRDAPSVVGEEASYCHADGTSYTDRIVSGLRIVAFSDPNDVLSYAIPLSYADEYLDSRLCPTITNVILNITPVHRIFKMGEVANPFEAHEGYDNDERVLGLIVGGIGTEQVAPAVASRCRWTRTVDE